MEANPYATPSANLHGTATGSGAESVAPSTIAQLSGTKGWVRFMSVLMWLMSALMILGAVSIVFASAVMPKVENAAYNAGMMFGMALYYGLLAFLMIYPAVKLWKYANHIGRLVASHAVTDLDAALAEQRRYWKFTGIMIIVFLCLAVVGGIAAVVFIGTTAMKAGALN